MSNVEALAKMIPPLSGRLHKGSCGRIGIVGGCREYTGAPYYAAMSSYLMGADLAYVFCTPEAAIPIKCYSPELVVIPALSESTLSDITTWIPRLHSVVIGPGLGRDERVLAVAKSVIEATKAADKPIIVDGDALFLVSQVADVIQGYKKAVLTPNAVEFGRLWKTAFQTELVEENELDVKIKQTSDLSQKFGGVTIVRKGLVDIISNGTDYRLCDEQGSPRRCGGQGDVLAGAVGVFSAWAIGMGRTEFSTLDAGLAACITTKKCANTAFQKHFRSTTTIEIIKEIGAVFQSTFPSNL